jgi:hypothetical protein
MVRTQAASASLTVIFRSLVSRLSALGRPTGVDIDRFEALLGDAKRQAHCNIAAAPRGRAASADLQPQ